MTWDLITPPAKRPVSIGEMKGHSLIPNERDDALLYEWISVAIEEAQDETSRQLITATWDEYFDAWPCRVDSKGDLAFVLHWAPLQSVTSVTYLDVDGAPQVLAGANYRVDTVSMRGRVVIKPTAVLPSLADQSQAITIRYVAGYGPDPADVPHRIREWIRLQVATRNEFRELVRASGSATATAPEMPREFGAGLLDAFRIVSIP